jgi:beta-mannosidase
MFAHRSSAQNCDLSLPPTICQSTHIFTLILPGLIITRSNKMRVTKDSLILLGVVTTSSLISAHSSSTYHEYDLTSKSLTWKLSNCQGDHADIPATIPGLVHTDLLSAGILTENPYYRFNELEQSWVSKESCWKYSTTLSFDHESFSSTDSSTSPFYLHLVGVDTIAQITWNDTPIGSTSNAFKTYSFLIPSPLIHSTDNHLMIQIQSPIVSAHESAQEYPYSVPHTENYNVWAEPSDRNFLRKAGSDYGWDWGPAYAPSGITGSITLYQSTLGKFENLLLLQDLREDFSQVILSPKIQIQNVGVENTSAKVHVYVNDVLVGEDIYSVHRGQETLHLKPFLIKDPILWYPVGFGSPHLYEVTVHYCPSSSSSSSSREKAFDSSLCQTQSRKIGIRQVELVREKIVSASAPPLNVTTSAYQARSMRADPSLLSEALPATDSRTSQVDPQTFYFKVNGQPVFARGANFIPIDSFQSRVTKSDRSSLSL